MERVNRIIRNRAFDFCSNTYVMGILNVTPDSFSDGGLHNSVDKAVEHALRMEAEGADMIDIGGESTRPGHVKVEAGEELARVIPVIEALRKRTDIPVSIDTTKPEVAAAAVAAGADIINTVEGCAMPQEMAEVIKSSGSFCVLTYENSYVNRNDFCEALIRMASQAEDYGIERDKIIIDPGVGFGKTQDENLSVINDLPFITRTGYPVLLGCSRKSFIEYALRRGSENLPSGKNMTDANERLPGTIVTTVLAFIAGAGIVRVHDVAENVQALKVAGAIRGR